MIRKPKWQLQVMDLKAENIENLLGERVIQYPVLYLLYSQSNRHAFLGETVQIQHDLLQHLRKGHYERLLLMSHEHLHQSALYTIEGKLLNYLLADEGFILDNLTTSRTRIQHRYYQQTYYQKELFRDLWEALLEAGFVKQGAQEIENRALFKLSPYHDLSLDQAAIKEELITSYQDLLKEEKRVLVFIRGEAGTGKSVLLSSLFSSLQEMTTKSSYLLVNHQEVLKTYHALSQRLTSLKEEQILEPEQFIAQVKETDLVLVDEAHLLLATGRSKTQLSDILSRTRMLVCIYDEYQLLRLQSHWDSKSFLASLGQDQDVLVRDFELTDQIRMRSSQEVWRWVDTLVKERKIEPIPMNHSGKNLFDFKIVKSAEDLKRLIAYRNRDVGLSRIVATYDYPYKPDGASYLVDPQGLALPWTLMKEDATWAERPDTLDEVGSIYTIQGFDLNYVGVLLGPSIAYDPKQGSLVLKSELYQDPAAFQGMTDLNPEEERRQRERIILNSLNVLMKRGVKGLYIHAVNPALRDHLLDLQDQAIRSRS
ncbi:DNA/RNA helicase domain-containing protein [Streptococcus oricebi]|uniref:Endonuclease n=1 Tax=Streptococcus oricebi TaxID=1547447 RepID=A0ABS5B0X4_9STRE|nr:DNA/RNA helicase domain-containing protein [Streptococcus oricebi]MBP2622478.1 endonuclease [Streptococcus oricebi]